MRLGIFAKTFPRPSVEETLDAVRAHGLDATQFNLSVAGLASMPDSVPAGLPERVHARLRERALDMAAVSGTFNMAHPEAQVRVDGLRRLEVLAAACPALGHRGHHAVHRNARPREHVAPARRELDA